MERDICGRDTATYTLYFNSHAHVERDSQLVLITKRQVHFNSHAHVERDNTAYTATLTAEISTHTLTWSVTQFVF